MFNILPLSRIHIKREGMTMIEFEESASNPYFNRVRKLVDSRTNYVSAELCDIFDWMLSGSGIIKGTNYNAQSTF